jgi:gliding motility-associated protein GldL
MNLTDIVQSSGWKNFMAKLYGIGASVVIIGALFKIQHWKGASIMLTLGLSTEAIIFFFSAFEPLHEDLDWTLVYPELAGMADPEEIEQLEDPSFNTSGRPLQRIEDLLGDSGITDESIKKLGDGFKKLNSTLSDLGEISKASVATQDFLSKLDNATDSLQMINDTYAQTNESIKESASNLTDAYFQTADMITKSGSEVASHYGNIAQAVKNEKESIEKEAKIHEDQLENLNKNLSALNAVYELQIKESNERMTDSKEVYKGLEQMIKNLKLSTEDTNRYREEINKLQESLSSLNKIYGNMLSAMNMIAGK